MKKIIFTFIFISSSLLSLAQYKNDYNKLKLSQGFGLEVFTDNKIQISDKDCVSKGRQVEVGTFSCLYQLRITYKCFGIISNTTIYMNKDKGFQFAPTQADFRLDFMYHITDKLELSIGHQCLHGISSTFIERRQLFGGYDKMRITYNIK